MKMFHLEVYRNEEEDIVIRQDTALADHGYQYVLLTDDQIEWLISALKQEADNGKD